MCSRVVDIGGGTTDVAVISLGGIVVSTSIKVAGDKFDDAIVRYMRKNHRINIGERTAENLKVILGTACADTPESKLTVKGGDMVSGLPTEIEVSSKEMYKAMSECVTAIVDAIFYVLEQTPPELCSDISDRGIVLTGGSSLISGLDRAVEERTGIRCVTAEDLFLV